MREEIADVTRVQMGHPILFGQRRCVYEDGFEKYNKWSENLLADWNDFLAKEKPQLTKCKPSDYPRYDREKWRMINPNPNMKVVKVGGEDMLVSDADWDKFHDYTHGKDGRNCKPGIS